MSARSEQRNQRTVVSVRLQSTHGRSSKVTLCTTKWSNMAIQSSWTYERSPDERMWTFCITGPHTRKSLRFKTMLNHYRPPQYVVKDWTISLLHAEWYGHRAGTSQTLVCGQVRLFSKRTPIRIEKRQPSEGLVRMEGWSSTPRTAIVIAKKPRSPVHFE